MQTQILARPSVTRWINDFRLGDDCAADLLWNFVKAKLTSLASRKIGKAIAYDEEDVAIVAFTTLCDGLQTGRYDGVENRQELWQLLATITINRARKLARDEKRIKRGGKFCRLNDNAALLNDVESPEPSPELSLLAKDECRRMISLLSRNELKVVAVLKVDGHTNEEIAEIVGCTRRSIQRRLNLIRDIWANELP